MLKSEPSRRRYQHSLLNLFDLKKVLKKEAAFFIAVFSIFPKSGGWREHQSYKLKFLMYFSVFWGSCHPLHCKYIDCQKYNFLWSNISPALPVSFAHLFTVPSTANKWYFQLYFWKYFFIIQIVLKPMYVKYFKHTIFLGMYFLCK